MTPRYPFGFGLSYTSFEYSDIRTDKDDYLPQDELKVTLTVKNTGDVSGDEIVQLYISDEYTSMVQPNIALQGFKRVSLEPGEAKTVTFTMPLGQLAFLDESMRWKIEKGSFLVKAGRSSADLPLEKRITVTEDLYIDGKTRGFYAK